MTRVRLERKRRRMTAWALALQARVHPSDLSKIEAGRLRPTAEQAHRIAEALGLPVETVFDHRGWPLEAELEVV
ncbi:MAG: helix-turn-helix transcriptional regulator [Bacillota bacterium]